MYVCASYYKPHELARRATIIAIATEIGPLFSGFLMAAIYTGLNGSGGLAGWRWMYMCVTPNLSKKLKLTFIVFVVVSLFLVLYGPHLLYLNSRLERNLTGIVLYFYFYYYNITNII